MYKIWMVLGCSLFLAACNQPITQSQQQAAVQKVQQYMRFYSINQIYFMMKLISKLISSLIVLKTQQMRKSLLNKPN